jgi:hypothetical protein
VQQIASSGTAQTFTFSNVCELQPAALAAATSSTAAQLAVDFGSGMSSSIVALLAELSAVSTSTLSTLTQQVSIDCIQPHYTVPHFH